MVDCLIRELDDFLREADAEMLRIEKEHFAELERVSFQRKHSQDFVKMEAGIYE